MTHRVAAFLALAFLLACTPLPSELAQTDGAGSAGTRHNPVRALELGIPDAGNQMTWEGCQLTPGCAEGGDEMSLIHDGDPSTNLFNPGTPDPSPSAPGIFIGWGATDCYLMRSSNPQLLIDQDHDGLRDECEFRLATAFAPMLRVSPVEGGCLAGEPYWAAKFIDNLPGIGTGDMVKLAYLPSYYNDCGVGGTGQFGHAADAEFIQLTVVYNYATSHWELVGSWLSAHSCVDVADFDHLECLGGLIQAGGHWGSDFEWPANRVRSFPRVYVAAGKHANYRSQSACDNGGTLWMDSCPNSFDIGRFRVWESHNLGSARYPFIDCQPSQSSLEERSGTECFWTGPSFRAWQPDIYPDLEGSMAYGAVLNSLVFQSTMVSATWWWSGSYGH